MSLNLRSNLDNVKGLVMDVLEHYPETRNNDNLLFVRACQERGCRTLEDLGQINLSVESITRMRRIIQNKEGLFKADDRVANGRKNKEVEIKEYVKNN